MTEIPEHLLKRSRERREALGLSEPGSAAAASPASGSEVEVAATAAPAPSSPAAAPVPAAAPAPPPPPKPDPPYVQAAKNRKRIPWWALPVVAGLPIWAGMYAFTLEPPSRGADDPLTLGAEIFAGKCASCHGTTGGGGVGPALANGAVVETFPDYQQHIEWVKLGSAGWPEDTYGAANKPVKGGMPSWEGLLTDEEITLVVRYEREVLGGADPEPELVAATEGEEAGAGG